MTTHKLDLPVLPFKNLFKAHGAKRVSPKAAVLFTRKIIDMARYHAGRMAKLARHAGRETINEEDVSLEPHIKVVNKAKGKTDAETFPLAPFKAILKGAGGVGKDAIRAGEAATMRFREYIIDKAVEHVETAISLAKHAGRETVKDKDIDLLKFT